MRTEIYVEHGKWATDYIAPTDAVMMTSTVVFAPPLDVLCPYFPYAGYVADLVVFAFLALLVMKVLGTPGDKQLQTSIIIYSEVYAVAFSVGVTVNAHHVDQGEAIAASMPWMVQLQQILLDVEDDKSDNPRVELKNVSVEWTPDSLLQASKGSDIKVVELSLKGGIPMTLSGIGNDRQLPSYVVVNDYPKTKEQLELFKEDSVDPNDSQLAAFNNMDLPTRPPSPYAVAEDHRHEELASYLTELGVKTDGYPAWQKRKKEMQKESKGVYFS